MHVYYRKVKLWIFQEGSGVSKLLFGDCSYHVCLFLSQTKYATEILERDDMSSCKSTPTLVATTSNLSANSGAPYKNLTLYRCLTGALQYLTFTMLRELNIWLLLKAFFGTSKILLIMVFSCTGLPFFLTILYSC